MFDHKANRITALYKQFYFFLNLHAFYFLSCLAALVRICSAILDSSASFPILGGKHSVCHNESRC